MKREENILDQAVLQLKEKTGLEISFRRDQEKYDAVLKIDDMQFIVEAKKYITRENSGAIKSVLKNIKVYENLPVILITDYMPNNVGEEYFQEKINYLDTAGNCYINYKKFFVRIEGQKRNKPEKTNQSRAFQEAGLKILFLLLSEPKSINFTYRELAGRAGVALGSVAHVMRELTDLNFYMTTKNGKFLKNKEELLKRWVISYHDVLRPRLVQKKMKFTNGSLMNWQDIPLKNSDDIVLWGGEPAAALITNYLFPEKYTIYTDGIWRSLIRDLGLAPAEDGQIEVLKMFWKDQEIYHDKPTVPALLVYADLIGSGIGRNIEIANIILKDELSHLERAIE
jgi:hypothetical protein